MIRFADGYHIFKENNCFGITPICAEVPLSLFSNTYRNKLQLSNCITLGSTDEVISDVHKELLTTRHPLKIHKRDKDDNIKENEYYKVKVTPITLFSDDYSGNKSKQHNPYESWSMNFAAMSFEDRTKRENTFFIWTAPKTDGINALTVIPYIADDLKDLEKGRLMFSAEENELVLVTAPLLFILADNPAHSNICGILRLTTLYPCRKCYFRNIKKLKNKDYSVSADTLNSFSNIRTKKDYQDALDVNKVIEGAIKYPVAAKNLSFRNLGSERLLDLESYNPARDTPVEVLRTILLGVGKYLINHLFKVVLKKNSARMDLLVTKLKCYETCKNYSRSFTKEVTHCGSFLGRDYKLLLQILPIIISKEFKHPVEDYDMILINRPISKLGKLCSLVFVRQVVSGFDQYVEDVHKVVKDLTSEVHAFDVETKNPAPFSCKPKMHLIHHLRDDLLQFSCSLHFEREKGEQFNKFLREHLFHTNRKETSKFLARKFGKQEVLKNIVDGGSWVSQRNNKRVKLGNGIQNFVSSLGDQFQKIMFGDVREFADNNNVDIYTLKKGKCGLFKYKPSPNQAMTFIGEIIEISELESVIQIYIPFQYTSSGDNIICRKGDLIEVKNENLLAKGALDLFMKDLNGNRIINMNKFGSIMLLRNNPILL